MRRQSRGAAVLAIVALATIATIAFAIYFADPWLRQFLPK